MKRLISAICALGLASAVTGCGSEPEQQPAGQTAADPDAPAGISVRDGRLTLPAVSGNPGAVYFTITNDGEDDAVIHSISIAGAGMAMLHETVAEGGTARMQERGEVTVPAGGSVAFEPGGLHVMAMGLPDDLAQGASSEATVTFGGGDKISFPVAVLPPGTEAIGAGS